MGEYKAPPGVEKVYLDVAKVYTSPLLLGPQLCDELIALVEHMFTGEEAEFVSHMKPMRGHTAAGLARASGKDPEEAAELLHCLAHEKHILGSRGKDKGEKERFMLMPIIPGTFEFIMLNLTPGGVTPWHRRFSELFENLFATGFLTEHFRHPVTPIRYLPVGELVEALPMAFPSDRLEVILERYSDFAVGKCQCRLSRQINGEGCGRMLETCTAMGSVAKTAVGSGLMKQAGRRDILEIKKAAEKEGLVTWMMNQDNEKFSNNSCSCCGCCCEALRMVNEFSHPGIIAPPHFMPRIDTAKCKKCGDCCKACPMGATVLMGEGDNAWIEHRPGRCIGCGLCVVACSNGARALHAVSDYREPTKNVPAYLSRFTLATLGNTFHVFRSRRRLRR